MHPYIGKRSKVKMSPFSSELQYKVDFGRLGENLVGGKYISQSIFLPLVYYDPPEIPEWFPHWPRRVGLHLCVFFPPKNPGLVY